LDRTGPFGYKTQPKQENGGPAQVAARNDRTESLGDEGKSPKRRKETDATPTRARLVFSARL